MSSNSKRGAETYGYSAEDVVYAGISNPVFLTGDNGPGPDDSHYYRKFISAYRRFVKILRGDDEAYTRLAEVEENLEDREPELSRMLRGVNNSFHTYSDLKLEVDSVESLSSLFGEQSFEGTNWQSVTNDQDDNRPDDLEPPYLEVENDSPGESILVVHTGFSDWKVEARLDLLSKAVDYRMSVFRIQQEEILERHEAAKVSLQAVQEVLFEYEAGRTIGRLLDEEERIDRNGDEKKLGANKRVTDDEIERQIEQLRSKYDIDPGNLSKNALAEKLRDEFGMYSKRHYTSRIDEIRDEE